MASHPRASYAEPEPVTSRDCVLRAHHVSKFSLRDANLDVGRGERVAIIGRTGEGKSVFLKCITGLLRPDDGSVEVLGRKVRGQVISIAGVGVAFQHPGLLDAYSIRRNLELAAAEPPSEFELQRLLDAVDLGSVDLDASMSGLSGGQVKRLALLRAVIGGTQLVILDEPTSGLDPATAERVADVLSRILGADRALLLVTHDYETAAKLCTRFLLLTPGGTLEELRSAGSPTIEERSRFLRLALASGNESRRQITGSRPTPWSVSTLTAALFATAMPIALASMALLGIMLVSQSSGISPIDISRHVPAIVVWAVFREIGPLVVGMLLAGRVGARVAAEIAGMSYTHQIASMRVLGLSPVRRLFLPFLVSAAIVFPLCIIAGSYAAILAAAAFTALPLSRLSIGASRFLSLSADAFSPALFVSEVIKGLLMSATVTACAFRFGIAPMESAQAVGSTVTKSVVIGTASIVLVDVLVSALIFAR